MFVLLIDISVGHFVAPAFLCPRFKALKSVLKPFQPARMSVPVSVQVKSGCIRKQTEDGSMIVAMCPGEPRSVPLPFPF